MKDKEITTCIACPSCNGLGVVNYTIKLPNITKGKLATELKRAGLSYREIAKRIGLNSPQSVVHKIEQFKKHQKNIKSI